VSKRIVIEPGAKHKNYWTDVWNYRGLFYFLAWRDVLVRYKQTVVGIAWTILRPLVTIGIMTFIGGFFHSPLPAGVPRILFVCAATLPWQFFANTFTQASGSLIGNSNLLTKVYFPRIIVPLSSVIACLLDFVISFAILIILMLGFRFFPDWKIILLPLFLLLSLLVAMGAGLYIAALNVKYRDFNYIVPFIVQFGVYIAPIAYSSQTIYGSHIPWVFKFLYSINPMVGVIDGFRWCIFGSSSIVYLPGFLISVAISFFCLLLGIWYFRRTEYSFADVI
jgi:lipopolysaccharide transport system permease protein